MTSKKQKRERSSSSSSHFSISDDDSPKRKSYKNKESEGRVHHRKHHKHRHRTENLSSGDDFRDKYKQQERITKHRDYDVIPNVRIKEEPLSDDERDRKYKARHSEQPRENGDSFQRNGSRHNRGNTRKKPEYSDPSQLDNRNRPRTKEEIQSDVEPEWGKKVIKTEKKEPPKNNAKPDFGLSGKLTEDANTFRGVVIKYSEPPEARKPKRRWRLYPFKGETSLPVLHIHRQSAYLMGRDRKVADIPIDHPSCSKQHAALQYRLVPFTRADGSSGRQIKLYVIDLESANGTFLNNNKIESKKYYELKERDVIKFGFSSREYVILHEHSKDSENDDDVNNED